MNLDHQTTACLDIGAVQNFKNWYYRRTGVNLSLGESFALFLKHDRGENTLLLADQYRKEPAK